MPKVADLTQQRINGQHIAAREALKEEWALLGGEAAPELFYRRSENLRGDLNAWHATEDRQRWTKVVVSVAQQANVERIVDIGCGAGHDLKALKAAGFKDLWGIEPNAQLAHEVSTALNAPVVTEIQAIQPAIETADYLICIDVLEHVTDPESFLGYVADTAKLGALLIEAVGNLDCATPLHLVENRGWHPGRALERAGWEQQNETGRLRLWKRVNTVPVRKTSVIVCAYRGFDFETGMAIGDCRALGWRVLLRGGDALITRVRSIAASRWWAETGDDVFVMVDDDIVFTTDQIARLAALCADGYDVIGAVYPVRNGSHVAVRKFGNNPMDRIRFGPDLPPVEIQYAATGFLAVHRRVIDALIPTMPLCHADQPFAFWPLFDCMVGEPDDNGVRLYLSEDWAFCERARQAGFKIWLDPTIKLNHVSRVKLNVLNMHDYHDLLIGRRPEDGKVNGSSGQQVPPLRNAQNPAHKPAKKPKVRR